MSTTTFAQPFVDFLNASPSPFHAVEEASRQLLENGYEKLRETEEWVLKPSGKYFFTRNHSTLFAFAVGGKFKAGNGFNIIGAHTDSPVLKLRPKTAVKSANFLQVGVQLYGGGLWHTWFDRDLGLAGRVIVQPDLKVDKFEHKLVRIDRPILKIPNLAIHLNPDVKEAFKFNTEAHLQPILATELKGQIEGVKTTDHHPLLLSLLAQELKCEISSIRDIELCLYDVQKSCIGGAMNEFIFSARLDNLSSSYCALTALLLSGSSQSIADDTRIRLIALFDNEEVGSESMQGAASNMMEQILIRITNSTRSKSDSEQNLNEIMFRKSFLISADMAHGVHPNYTEKHQSDHRPAINGGLVIKNNANQRYATNSVTSFYIHEIAKQNEIPLQEFVVKNDSPCGTTIGPILAAHCGMRTVDLGAPQLAMHSIRETCGTTDIDYSVKLFKAFFEQFGNLDAKTNFE